MTITRLILLLIVFIPSGMYAKSNETVLIVGNMVDDQSMLSNGILFWSKVFILVLIVVFGFFSYKRFRSEEQ
jgi:hypothetical protein